MRNLLAITTSLFLILTGSMAFHASPVSAAPLGTPDPMETEVSFSYSANFIDMTITVLNAQGLPVTSPLTISVSHVGGSAGLTSIGPVLDIGGGQYTVALIPMSGVGTDIFGVTIDDGVQQTVVTPDPELCIGDIANGMSEDCNGNFIPDECEIAAGLVDDANANGVPDPCESFRRGDCNGNQVYDLLDFLHGINYMFGDSSLTLECADACDTDDNGTVDVHDMVVLIQAMFAAGPGIAQPFPDCGLDPTSDNLDCATYSICP